MGCFLKHFLFLSQETTGTSTASTTYTTTSSTTETTSLTTPSTTSSTTETTSLTSPSTISSTTETTGTSTTPTTASSTTEFDCPGVWSSWFNDNTPSVLSPDDTELLTSNRFKLCPLLSDDISSIQCRRSNETYLSSDLLSEEVTCNKDIGLVCTVLSEGKICNDYEIRVCCVPTVTTTVPTTTPSGCFCDSVPARKCNETWKEECKTVTCIEGQKYIIEYESCTSVQKPVCSNGRHPVSVPTEDGCCSEWDCDYICYIWGDQHFLTFDNIYYNFIQNCSYVLLEELVPTYNFSVILDNYYCISSMPNFCGKTIIIHYNGNIIHVMAKQPVKVIFNGEPVSLPYNAEGAEIFGNIYFAYVKIPSIRSSILTTKYMFFIKVSEKFFQSNTQGQCGSPKNKHDECKRKNGKVEPTNCCSETAFEWKVDDPNKQHCSTIPKVVPCKEKPTKPPCKYSTTVCDAILGDSFSICRSNIDLSNYIKACAYDNCETNETHCCSLEAAALKCKENGFCVDWRQSTNGLCKMTCSSNFIYKPCAIKNHNYCKNNKIITGETFDEATEGCFCPSGMMLSEDRTKCVNSCLTCRDNSGNKRQNGEEWHHPNNTCISYQCLEGNLIKTEIVCSSYPICKETEKIWDEYHCCYKCPVKEDNCKLQAKPLKIIKDNCTATVEVHSCEGTCSSYSIFDYTKDKMMHNCNCCQEFTTETKEVTLNCKNSLTMQYSYISALECKCTRCLNSAK